MNCERQQFDEVARVVCGKLATETEVECFANRSKRAVSCGCHKECRIAAMTKQQIDYVLHPLENESHLKACPGSGKTESIALKAAYTLRAKRWNHAGIAFLTFTNNAANEIKERVRQSHAESVYPHFVGTFDSWLHGYILNPFGHRDTKYGGENGDHSISVIDRNSSAAFLHAYKAGPGIFDGAPVMAHQFFFDASANNVVVFDSGDQALDGVRKKFELSGARVNELKRIKEAFLKKGFVTHADVQTICYRVLHASSTLRCLVAKRFPFVIVDECQDLSPSQLCLLDELRQAGTKLHLVGDLNQAIHSFRKAFPKQVQDFVEKRTFATLPLSANFRSVQPIVDVCGRIVANQDPVNGRKQTGSEPACVYFVYGSDSFPKLMERFESFVRGRNVDPSKCLVLARGRGLVAQLGSAGGTTPSNKTERLAHAINLWKCGAFEFRDEALSVVGEFIADNFFPGEIADVRYHHCPRSYDSKARWRVLLARVLDKCGGGCLGDFDRNWTKWAATVNAAMPAIVESESPEARRGVQVSFRAPNKKKAQPVSGLFADLTAPSITTLRASTIHAAKGETVEAVLVVSSTSGSGRKGGFWRHWLDSSTDDGEHARFAYVASSRPRQLLAWAIPKLQKGDAERLTALGFQPVS